MSKGKVVPTNKDEAIAFHREELERLTGKMVDLRSREKYNESMRNRARARRERLRQLEELVAAKGLEPAGPAKKPVVRKRA